MQKLHLNLMNLEKAEKIKDRNLKREEKINEWRNIIWKQAS